MSSYGCDDLFGKQFEVGYMIQTIRLYWRAGTDVDDARNGSIWTVISE